MSILRLYIKHLLYWLLWFALCRLVFVCYNYKAIKEASAADIILSFGYGFRLDLSMSGYIIAPLLLYTMIVTLFNRSTNVKIISLYYYAVLSFTALLTVADCELYRKWGNKINGQVFVYISHPKEMMLSAASSPLLLLLGLMLFLIIIGSVAYRKWLRYPYVPGAGKWLQLGLSVVLCLVTFLGIRGNLGVTAINQSMVCYSNKEALNTTAVNSSWNALYYVFSNNGDMDPKAYTCMPAEEADNLFNTCYNGPDSTVSILTTKQPNVVVIMLESWTASAVNSITGINNLTPNFDLLLKESLLWDSAYASGNRTEKGLVSILSGFPAQPVTSIITEPDKVKHLPSLSADLRKIGYHTSFFYGGEVEFANMKSYLLQVGFESITDKHDFNSDQLNSKWGAHDEFVFQKALETFNHTHQPFFSTIMTLSSHEPFEVPMPTKVTGGDDVSKFKNSLMYSDLCLGNFMRLAKQQSWYNNTIFVLVADHGHEIGIDNIYFFDPVNFRIPLLVTGGALRPEYRGQRWHTIASQTDIAHTILTQLGLNAERYPFSANLCNLKRYGFAQFEYSDGLGFTDQSCELLYDNSTKNCYCFRQKQAGADSLKTITKAKAYQQKIVTDYLKN